MKFKPLYLVGFLVYVCIVLVATLFFGVSEGAIVGIAGIVAPAIGFLVNGIELGDDGSQDGSADDDPQPEPTSQTLVDPFSERKERAKSNLSDYITLIQSEQGKTELHLDFDGIRDLDRKAMLYVFGRWAESEEDPQLSPIVTKQDVRRSTELKGGAVGTFLAMMGPFIEWHQPEKREDQMKLDDERVRFQLNESHVIEAAEYILGEREAPN